MRSDRAGCFRAISKMGLNGLFFSFSRFVCGFVKQFCMEMYHHVMISRFYSSGRGC